MNFVGKRILVTGGNGYLGNYFAARFVQRGATVMALSRSGTKHRHRQNDKIEWIRGNILEPTLLKEKINSADVIVHTIGTLFDSSVLKGVQPGDVGTYEQINRDSFKSLLSAIEKQKRIIYISSAGHPPFLQRYLTTKKEAQKLLSASNNEGYSLRPGFIYSLKHRWWSIPIKWQIAMWNKVYPSLQKIISQNTILGKWLRQFRQGENIDLQVLGNCVLELSLNGGQKDVYQVSEMYALSTKFQNQHPM